MLISHYRHLAEEAPSITHRELILRGAEERLAPIMMTALTTGLARIIDVDAQNRRNRLTCRGLR